MKFIINLGWNCKIKEILRDLNKNKSIKSEFKTSLESQPIDFVQSPDLNKILNLLENKYNDLTNKLYLEYQYGIPVPKDNPKLIQHYFLNTKYNIRFMHHFTSNINEKNNKYSCYEYVNNDMIRRGKRTFEFIEQSDELFFIRYIPEINSKLYANEMKILKERLPLIFPNKKFTILLCQRSNDIKQKCLDNFF